MQCVSPFMIKHEGEIFSVPCGKCVACKIARVREWTVRILHESEYYKHSVFVTLTYDDDHLPINNTLEKKEYQKFMKRLRKALPNDDRIKYFACGEYGEESERPHYHAIILGLRLCKDTKDLIEEKWPQGFVRLGTVTYDSIRYVLDYMHKKYNGEMAEELYDKRNRERPFQLMSLGMGKRHAMQNVGRYADNLYLTVRGKKMGLPQYYKRLYGLDKETLKTVGRERAVEKVDKLLARCNGDVRQLSKEERKSAHQRELNLEARRGLHRRKL